MTTTTLTLTDFLLARIAEDEAVARAADSPRKWRGPETMGALEGGDSVLVDPARVLAECEAKRRIVEWHRNWPVLVESAPTFEQADAQDVNAMTYRVSKQIAWTTEQKYREHFGTEPPTGPILRALAAIYSDHPDYREEWRP